MPPDIYQYVSRHSLNVLDISQIFPIAHLRPQYQAWSKITIILSHFSFPCLISLQIYGVTFFYVNLQCVTLSYKADLWALPVSGNLQSVPEPQTGEQTTRQEARQPPTQIASLRAGYFARLLDSPASLHCSKDATHAKSSCRWLLSFSPQAASR